MGTLFVTNVYECSVCGSIIPNDKCAESHGQDCRPPNNSKTKSWKYQQMTKTTFPCPRIILHKLPSNLSEKSVGKFLARGKPKYNPYSYSLWGWPKWHTEPFTEEEVRERIRYLGEKGGPLPRWYPRDRGIEKRKLINRTVRIPTDEQVEARRKKKKSQEKPNYVGALDSSDSDSEDETIETDKPFACPLPTCGLKLRERSQLKSHFIMHLENNPWACPFPGCNVKSDSQPHFKRHVHWHIYPERKLACCRSCGQTYSTKKEMKEHNCFEQHPIPELLHRRAVRKFLWAYGSLKKHYDDLKEKQILFGESDERDIYFDFNYKINIDAIIETDPVFVKACEIYPTFWDVLFRDEQEHPGTSNTGTTAIVVRRNPWKDPYTCPLSRCGIKLRSRSELKSHFIMHLENNPWACPIPGCNVKSDSQPHFRRHQSWHRGIYECCKKCGYTSSSIFEMKKHNCFTQFPAPDLTKRHVKGGDKKSYEYLALHYMNLKDKGLVAGNQRILYDSDYKIDMDAVIQIDPVFIQVIKENPGFRDELFGDEHEQPSTSTSRTMTMTMKEAQEANDYKLAKTLDGMERNLSSAQIESEEQLFDVIRTPYHYDNDTENLGDILPFTSSKPYVCPLKKCKTGSELKTRAQLKKHFILHLNNNPYACPIPECNAKFNAQGGFKYHMEWHLGQEDQDKLDQDKSSVRTHYADLQSRGLLLEESEEHALKFDFNYKVDIDTIIQTDEILLKVCMHDETFYDRLFGDELQLQQPSTSISTSVGVGHQKLEETKNKNDEIHLELVKVRRDTMHRDLKKLENGKNMCTLCKFESNTEIGFKRHWLSQHSMSMEKPSIRDELSSTSASTNGESPLETNMTIEIENDANNGSSEDIATVSISIETVETVRADGISLETAPDGEKQASVSADGHIPPVINNETEETENLTTVHEHFHDHDSNQRDIYLKRLENGQFECTQCKLSCKSEAGGKRHWLLKHNVKIHNKEKVHPKVEDGSGPPMQKISSGISLAEEKPHGSKNCAAKSSPKLSRKRKIPKDPIPDSNVKSVKVEPELDLGLNLIAPKKEEADCDVDIKPEINANHVKVESEDFVCGDDGPPCSSSNVQVKVEPK